jgi:bacterioferritin-associated ferredoxin
MLCRALYVVGVPPKMMEDAVDLRSAPEVGDMRRSLTAEDDCGKKVTHAKEARDCPD